MTSLNNYVVISAGYNVFLVKSQLKNHGSGQCLDTRQSSIPGQAECGQSISTQVSKFILFINYKHLVRAKCFSNWLHFEFYLILIYIQIIYWSKWFHLRFPIHVLNYHDQPIPGLTRPGLYMAEYISLHNTDYGSQYFHVKVSQFWL